MLFTIRKKDYILLKRNKDMEGFIVVLGIIVGLFTFIWSNRLKKK
jgi:hypothetical protein